MNSVGISLIFTCIGIVISYFSFRNSSNHDLKADASKNGEVKTKLDYISKGVDDIRLDIKAQDRKISEMTERIARVEESTKSAHHRIDNLEEK